MTDYYLIGHTGFIGRHLAATLVSAGIDYTGISSSEIRFSSTNKSVHRQSDARSTSRIILDSFTDESVVINASWIPNLRLNRNSALHSEWADREINLIIDLKTTKCSYISLGTIAEIDDLTINNSYDTEYARSKKRIVQSLENLIEKYHWARIASAYGTGDSRDWLITQLQKQGELVNLQDEQALLNLSHVNSICNSIVKQIILKNWGEFNYWSKQWMNTKNIKRCYLDLIDPVLESPKTNYFSKIDSNGVEVISENILDFFKILRAMN